MKLRKFNKKSKTNSINKDNKDNNKKLKIKMSKLFKSNMNYKSMMMIKDKKII
jgi:hypothetical protein